VFIDTFHLFPETHAFLADMEALLGFKAHVFAASGFADAAAFAAAHGADLWRRDLSAYDQLCKVEPFSRALTSLACDCMLNGRRRDHGAERAQLEAWEAGSPVKCQPLAFWEFRDCFDYLQRQGVPSHPLHAAGYPSIGDAHSTVPVPRERWFDYGGERSGRFVGLVDKDGKAKTECGIHSDSAQRTFERDLWPEGQSAVIALSAERWAAEAAAGAATSQVDWIVDTLLVVYAPWCPFCQKMEAELEKLAAMGVAGLRVSKLRGDEHRDFVKASLATNSFPTILAFPAGAGGRFVKHGSEERSAEALLQFARTARVQLQ